MRVIEAMKLHDRFNYVASFGAYTMTKAEARVAQYW